MTAKELLADLKALGTDQNIKVYTRHGVGANVYGVSYSNLSKLKKKVKVDHAVAIDLWESGNHDARVLATMIADPDAATEELLNQWVSELDSYVITDAFSSFAAKSGVGRTLAEEWRRSREEWVSSAGWNIIAMMANHDDDTPDKNFHSYLSTIAATIHTAPNRTRYSMNSALIAIGGRSEALAELATSAAEGIGTVEVDHGETGCKTPDAIPYIKKVRKRKIDKNRKK